MSTWWPSRYGADDEAGALNEITSSSVVDAAGLGRNNVNWIVEQITAPQQMGTHLDGLNHLQDGDRIP